MAFSREDFQKATKIIMKKAAEDEKFKCLCISDPELALKEVEDEDIPEELKLTFVENLEAFNDHPEANEVVIELGDKDCCRFKFMERGICTTRFVAEEISDDYNLDDCAEVED